MRSIRRSLVLGTTLGTAAVLLAGSLILFFLVRAGLIEQFDHALDDNARLFASTVEARKKKSGVDTDKLDMREFEAPDRPGYLQLWWLDGSVVFRSTSLRGGDLERFEDPTGAPVHRWIKLPDGRTGRAVGMRFVPLHEVSKKKDTEPRPPLAPAQPIALVFARDAAPVLETLTLLGTLLGLVGLVTIAISGAVLRTVIWRSLRPLDRLAAQIGGLGEKDLSARIELREAPPELQPVRDQLNDLLGRLDKAFQRERVLSADLAHELRTPLAGLRSTMDVALARQRPPEEYRDALGECLEITCGMQGMCEKLLCLFRLEMGSCEIRPQEVSPDDLIRDSWRQLEPLADRRRLRVRWALGVGRAIVTEPSLLGLAVRNVLENAACYADEGGSVSIESSIEKDRLEIRVANSGSALNQEQAEHAFDLFWRGDAVRREIGVHCGLGLSLVRRVVEALGGSARIKAQAGGDFEVAFSVKSLSQ